VAAAVCAPNSVVPDALGLADGVSEGVPALGELLGVSEGVPALGDELGVELGLELGELLGVPSAMINLLKFFFFLW
jgi:hypothetical protein